MRSCPLARPPAQSKEDIEALVAQSQKRSAVFDALTNPADVTVEVA